MYLQLDEQALHSVELFDVLPALEKLGIDRAAAIHQHICTSTTASTISFQFQTQPQAGLLSFHSCTKHRLHMACYCCELLMLLASH